MSAATISGTNQRLCSAGRLHAREQAVLLEHTKPETMLEELVRGYGRRVFTVSLLKSREAGPQRA